MVVLFRDRSCLLVLEFSLLLGVECSDWCSYPLVGIDIFMCVEPVLLCFISATSHLFDDRRVVPWIAYRSATEQSCRKASIACWSPLSLTWRSKSQQFLSPSQRESACSEKRPTSYTKISTSVCSWTKRSLAISKFQTRKSCSDRQPFLVE